MDVLKVIAYNLTDSSIVDYEVSKTQTPDTPVATHLTNNKLSLSLGLCHCFVNLLKRVDVFIVHLAFSLILHNLAVLLHSLSICRYGQQQEKNA